MGQGTSKPESLYVPWFTITVFSEYPLTILCRDMKYAGILTLDIHPEVSILRPMIQLPFTKMHGLGNDFVVVDARPGRPGASVTIDSRAASVIADRHRGVGCDQLIILEGNPDAETDGAATFMRIRNPDGGEVGACGNATRCVGAFLMEETGDDCVRLRTNGGLLKISRAEGGQVTVDMGEPRTDWHRIPLRDARDTLHIDLVCGPLSDPAAVNVGNPHATFFVGDAEAIPLADLGPQLEHHQLFPERVNVGIAEPRQEDRIRLRVWERGAGITLACGTAACAALVNAHRRNLTARSATVEMDGGDLLIEWRDDNHILMSGPAAVSFTGSVEPAIWS